MSPEALQQRLDFFLQQDRLPEARDLLETYLATSPDDGYALIMYTKVLLSTGDKEKAREIMGPLLAENPDNTVVLYLAAEVELAEDKYAVAEQYARAILDQDARDADAFTMLARIRLNQRNYDGAIKYADEALAIEPEDTQALNLRIMAASILGREDVAITVEDALHLDPENPSTIAGHAYSLLTAGKYKEALERARYALSLNPQNDMARYVMLEGLKARNPIYRGYFAYQMAMSRLSGGASYGISIGLYLAVRYLSRLAGDRPDLAPFLYPIVYLCVGLFLLSWIIGPLMNFYLLTNKYGRLLLDDDDKLMAKLVGGSLAVSIFCAVAYSFTGVEQLLLGAFLGVGMMIPFGSFLNPVRERQKTITSLATAAIGLVGLAGVALLNSTLLLLAGVGLLGYQFLINAMMAKEAGRTFGD
ncbi:lipopolysaccharide assembly protein LapB [Lewinella sp. 4G2]|uniref:tetratricopeptide repeat protein n=1 Tax=Lewinella sp. 4G2 TaxID=1803372 RepID=UPI0007B4D855|nr:tetratricopeptide repeat protein [Lewinella sp. 4G2]OAV45257.1 hypothetical protein A3850_012470 [Lewinella sp. 4G2]